MIKFTTPKRSVLFGGWARGVVVDGQEYHVVVTKGKSVRIPYKPRGKNVGYQWHGSIYIKGDRRIWCGRVNKSTGVKGMLVAAGVIKGEGNG